MFIKLLGLTSGMLIQGGSGNTCTAWSVSSFGGTKTQGVPGRRLPLSGCVETGISSFGEVDKIGVRGDTLVFKPDNSV